MIDLTKAFEIDNGMISNGVVVPESVFEAARSDSVTYSNDLVSTQTFYNSLSQVNANRIARVSYTYTNDFVTSATITYYQQDGTTVYTTESYSFVYSGDNLLRVEVN